MKKVKIFSADCDDRDNLDRDKLERRVNDFLNSIPTKFETKVEWMQSSEERRTIITAIITYDM